MNNPVFFSLLYFLTNMFLSFLSGSIRQILSFRISFILFHISPFYPSQFSPYFHPFLLSLFITLFPDKLFISSYLYNTKFFPPLFSSLLYLSLLLPLSFTSFHFPPISTPFPSCSSRSIFPQVSNTTMAPLVCASC